VKDLPVFKSFARQIADFFSGADFCGYNPYKLDLPLLMEELMRAGVEFDVQKRRIVDVQRIFHMMEQRNLAAAYQFYCNKNLEKCHSAEDDTQATYEVLIAQLDRYEHLGTEVEKICSMTGNPIGRFVDLAGRIVEGDDGRENFNFGKYKGVAVEEVFAKDPGYYSWMMNGDFPAYTKKKLTEIRLRMKR
jgi:DNA polymerase-3 subunit epsilon